ncbi:disease resistance protein RGA2 [Elaeis guineensis]|uniref:Disease resistance protein RGA2-like n=1 Tax=Elaeis guineensis var. tenera TaxID=51953 RepID=A0A6I9QZM7_ELAGV|nr:disease resistance protein RGA2-like [Elaeis guineensis]XP_029119658.1 disease resistance protein RGA2-like [Elaeis guineensis]
MAEAAVMAVVSPILKLVIDKLGSGFCEELGLARGATSDIGRLQSVLSTINDVLDDAQRRSISDKALTGWLRKLKDAAFDADDVVDEFQYEALRRRNLRRNQLIGRVSDFFSPSNQFAFRLKMAHNIKRIHKRFDHIAEERSKFHLAEGSTPRRTIDRETFSVVNESEVYGRDEDKEKIINFLVSADDRSNVSVLPIVGLGGVGKTTLAQLAYNDQGIKEHFDLKLWVCVSDDFRIQKIVKAIIESATGQECDLSNLEAAQLQLQTQLSGRRFLLVLDDVWNEDEAEWERLKTLLRNGKQGSKIVTTTRSDVVSRIMGTVAPHKLQCLTMNDCWTLFKQRAFGPEREEETPRLVEIGKEIVAKCGGLPLAAKALGSLMRFKTEAEWEYIRGSELWRLPVNENSILPALRLSYDHLPSDLKQCFAYCSIFPKDYVIEREKLIQLWISEGFIQTLDGDIHEEEVGNQYFNSLLWRSLFQDIQKDQYSNIRTCKMHDLVHDLACFVARDESSIMRGGMKRSIPHGCRYSSIVSDDTMSSTTLKADFEVKKLRSLILLRQRYHQMTHIKQFAFDVMLSLTHLRALDLSKACIKELPRTICKLKHLRLLDLSKTEIALLPLSITNLHHLRTLNLTSCYRLQNLPEGMCNMSRLRHLDIRGCRRLICMPRWLGQLHNLQTLSMFIVGKEHGRTISELAHLNLISDGLEIRELGNVQDPMEATKTNLASKTNLRSLELHWKRYSVSNMALAAFSIAEVGEVFERLKPHSNLKELSIRYYPGIKFPTWMTRMELASSPIHNLVRIELMGLERCKCLPALGHLPFLERLHILNMNAVRRIGVEFYGDGGIFPSLRGLTMWGLRDLEEWSTETTAAGKSMMAFPSLEYFTLGKCPKLRVAPWVPPSVVDVSIEGDRLLSSASTRGLHKLRSLSIKGCEALLLLSWWEWMQDLTALTRLHIRDNKLMCLPKGILQLRMPSWWECIQDLTVLTKLTICDDKLMCLPKGILELRMPSLQNFDLECSNLKSISGEERDKQQQPPTFFMTIQDLQIQFCGELTALPKWLGSLTSLRSLQLQNCPKLEMLPDGLQCLTALWGLQVCSCPQLARRCERERGEDWPKIAHIPNIHIYPRKGVEEDREENSQRTITRLIRKSRLTSCMGHG